jgi:hypothetical protein
MVLVAALGGCTGKTTTSTSADTSPTALQWYLDCGDPVCQGYTGPFDGVSACADLGVAVGDACTDEGLTCDPQDDCNALAICASEDPTQLTGGCPISLRRYKHAVHYLSEGERDAAARRLLAMRLASWRYTWEGDGPPAHLGFLIDDQPGSPAVQPDGAHVDLYGYTSLAVAAVQAQQAEIDALKGEVEELRRACARP